MKTRNKLIAGMIITIGLLIGGIHYLIKLSSEPYHVMENQISFTQMQKTEIIPLANIGNRRSHAKRTVEPYVFDILPDGQGKNSPLAFTHNLSISHREGGNFQFVNGTGKSGRTIEPVGDGVVAFESGFPLYQSGSSNLNAQGAATATQGGALTCFDTSNPYKSSQASTNEYLQVNPKSVARKKSATEQPIPIGDEFYFIALLALLYAVFRFIRIRK